MVVVVVVVVMGAVLILKMRHVWNRVAVEEIVKKVKSV